MAHKLAVATHHGAAYVSEWILGLIGLAAAGMGVFLLVGGEDQYVGLGGDLSWRVGDVAPAWGWTLLIGGLVLAVASMTATRYTSNPSHGGDHLTAARRHTDALLAHGIAFVLVNAFLWTQDLAISSGLDYAYWVTIPWAAGLAVHVAFVMRERARERSASR